MRGVNILKVGLALMLFVCLADMAYGYYQLVRFLALVAFAILAYESHKKGENTASLVYGALSLLFQPIFKISLGREIWNIVDTVVSIGLLLTVISPFNHSSSDK
jgi:hypothetical protein